MKLSKLEEDFLGDLAQDDHALHEVFGFVRLHRPGASESEVFAIGRALVASWLERGWLQIAPNPDPVVTVTLLDDLMPTLDRLGETATRYFDGSPWLRPTSRVAEDVAWLRGTT